MFEHPLLAGMSKADRAVFAEEFRKARAGKLGFYDENNKLQKAPVTDNVGMTSGLEQQPIPLEAPAKLLYVVPTPLRNSIPREVTGGPAYSFRKITGLNTTHIWGSVAEATSSTTGRNNFIARSSDLVTVNYKTVEMEDLLTPEAREQSRSTLAQGDFNAAELVSLGLLQSTFLAEEYLDLGGNIAALAAPSQPVADTTQLAAALGSLTPGGTYSVKVSAISLQGYLANATGRGTSDSVGESLPSTVTTVTLPGSSTGSTAYSFHWTHVWGAVGYNVYAHTTTSVTYTDRVYVNRYDLTTLATTLASAHTPNNADQTANALDYDGIIKISEASTAGYRLSLDGSTLTGDSTSGVAEIDTMFKHLYDDHKISPTKLLVNTAQKKKIDQLVAGSSAPILRIDAAAGDLNITGTIGVKSLMNRYMGVEVPVEVHPFLPPGKILAPVLNGLGPYYANARIASNLVKALCWDYRQEEFGKVKRAQEFGVNFRGALVNFADFGFASLSNVG